MPMIRMPFATPSGFVDRVEKKEKEAKNEIWFIFQNGQLLMEKNSTQPYQTKTLIFEHNVYLGIYRNCHIHAAELPISAKAPTGTLFVDLRQLFGTLDEGYYALAGRALQLLLWNRTHQYCGQCGNKTLAKKQERAKQCLNCGLLAFPKISPAIMALVQKGEEILLAKGVQFPLGFYSILAGFVDPGETLEQCVDREVFEEVGLKVKNLRYFGSQSWPFPNSLMIGFTCDWKEGEIRIDPKEIIEARWFNKKNLPLLPQALSLSRIMIDATLGL